MKTSTAITCLLAGLSASVQSPELSIKEMFYNPGGVTTMKAVAYLPDVNRRLREVNYSLPLRHCGIHFWFENENGSTFDENLARKRGGRFVVWIRASCNGAITVFDLTAQSPELTPRTYQDSSGLVLDDRLFRVPGDFELGESPTKRLIIVWARSQTEMARNVDHAPVRLREMTEWASDGRPLIVHASDSMTSGEIGNYVVNRRDGGVAAEIQFTSR